MDLGRVLTILTLIDLDTDILVLVLLLKLLISDKIYYRILKLKGSFYHESKRS